MKQFLSIFVFVIISTIVLAQPQPQQILDSQSSLMSTSNMTFDAEHKAALSLAKTANTECLADSMYEFFDGEHDHRFYYQYDSNGNLLEFITQSRWSEGFRNGYRYSHTYNADGLETQELRLIWNTSSSSWNNDLRYTSVYNLQGNRIEYKMEVWNGMEYLNSDLEIHNYNQSGQLLESVFMDWANNAWEVHIRYLYEYDQNGNLITETLLDWNGTEYVNEKKTTSDYNASDEVISKLVQYWSGQEWFNHQRQTFEYNGELLGEVLFQDWTGTGWQPWYRVLNTYDQNGLLLEELHQSSDGLTFEDRYKHTHTYNSQGSMTSFLREQSNSGSPAVWEYIDVYLYNYDQFGNRTEISYRDWYGQSWGPWYEYHYYFSCYSTALNEAQSKEDFTIYPNPTSGQVFIRLEKNSDFHSINLIDLSGKLLKTTPVNKPLLQLNLSAPSGIYLLELRSSSGSRYQKLLLE